MSATITQSNTLPSSPANSLPNCPSFSNTIYWGDGAVSLGSSPVTHTYVQASIYTVAETVTETFCTNPKTPSQVSVATMLTVPSSTTGFAGSGLGKTPTTISPAFSVRSSNLTVTLTDVSSAFNESVRTVTFAFGDGAVSTAGAAGLTVTHTFASFGTYRIVETVIGSAQVYCSTCGAGTYPTFTTATNVTVAAGMVTQNVTVGSTPAPTPTVAFGGPVLAAVFGGAVLALLPWVLQTRYGTILGGSAIAAAVGYAVGVGWI